MALAQKGCGKFHPTNAPTAIQNNVSNMMSLLCYYSYSAGNDCDGPKGRPVVGQAGADVPKVGAGVEPNVGVDADPTAGVVLL